MHCATFVIIVFMFVIFVYIWSFFLFVLGIVPVSYLIRNLGEGNLRMRHHYLGGTGTKPLAHALKVSCPDVNSYIIVT